MWLKITWVGVADEWSFQVCMANALPAPPLPHPRPPVWVWLCSTSVQCSHAGLRCINHWTTDTELCNQLAPSTIVAVAAVQTGSRESLITMPTTPATRLLSTQMRLLPFMHRTSTLSSYPIPEVPVLMNYSWEVMTSWLPLWLGTCYGDGISCQYCCSECGKY